MLIWIVIEIFFLECIYNAFEVALNFSNYQSAQLLHLLLDSNSSPSVAGFSRSASHCPVLPPSCVNFGNFPELKSFILTGQYHCWSDILFAVQSYSRSFLLQTNQLSHSSSPKRDGIRLAQELLATLTPKIRSRRREWLTTQGDTLIKDPTTEPERIGTLPNATVNLFLPQQMSS
jgi:hypothetical protein